MFFQKNSIPTAANVFSYCIKKVLEVDQEGMIPVEDESWVAGNTVCALQ